MAIAAFMNDFSLLWLQVYLVVLPDALPQEASHPEPDGYILAMALPVMVGGSLSFFLSDIGRRCLSILLQNSRR